MLQMKIGDAYYNCSCVRYVSKITPDDEVTPDDQETSQPPRLIIVISVGFGLLAILIIIAIIVAACRRCRKKPNEGIVVYNNSGSVAVAEAYNNGVPFQPVENQDAYAQANEPSTNNVGDYFPMKNDFA